MPHPLYDMTPVLREPPNRFIGVPTVNPNTGVDTLDPSVLDFAGSVEKLHDAMLRLLGDYGRDTAGGARDTFCFACRWLIVNVADPEHHVLLGSRRPEGHHG